MSFVIVLVRGFYHIPMMFVYDILHECLAELVERRGLANARLVTATDPLLPSLLLVLRSPLLNTGTTGRDCRLRRFRELFPFPQWPGTIRRPWLLSGRGKVGRGRSPDLAWFSSSLNTVVTLVLNMAEHST